MTNVEKKLLGLLPPSGRQIFGNRSVGQVVVAPELQNSSTEIPIITLHNQTSIGNIVEAQLFRLIAQNPHRIDSSNFAIAHRVESPFFDKIPQGLPELGDTYEDHGQVVSRRIRPNAFYADLEQRLANRESPILVARDKLGSVALTFQIQVPDKQDPLDVMSKFGLRVIK